MKIVFTNELNTEVFDLSFYQVILQRILKFQEQENEALPKSINLLWWKSLYCNPSHYSNLEEEKVQKHKENRQLKRKVWRTLQRTRDQTEKRTKRNNCNRTCKRTERYWTDHQICKQTIWKKEKKWYWTKKTIV